MWQWLIKAWKACGPSCKVVAANAATAALEFIKQYLQRKKDGS